VILFFRLLSWTAKYAPSHSMLFASAGVLSAALLLALLIVGTYVDHDRTFSKHGGF
jgi:hypothetical protein